MNRVRGMWVAVALPSAVMALALAGQAEKPMAVGQQDVVGQDSGQQEKHAAELSLTIQPDNVAAEGQEAQQKVMLEYVAADVQVVKGKPYSAGTSTETVQTLPDGNRIVHRTVSKFYRDSEGRTRREETFGNVDPEHPSPHEVKVFIDDPVNGTAYVLDNGSKSADKMVRLHAITSDQNAEDDGARVMVKSIKDAEMSETGSPNQMLLKIRNTQTSHPDTIMLQVSDENREVAKEDLGTKTVAGVECSGTRKTITIPAGAVGNEQPISIVSETWFSPAIGAVVQSTSDDPRFGKTTYQLTNVQLTEPVRSLFEPPADFKVNTPK